jgi:hypothetical protein
MSDRTSSQCLYSGSDSSDFGHGAHSNIVARQMLCNGWNLVDAQITNNCQVFGSERMVVHHGVHCWCHDEWPLKVPSSSNACLPPRVVVRVVFATSQQVLAGATYQQVIAQTVCKFGEGVGRQRCYHKDIRPSAQLQRHMRFKESKQVDRAVIHRCAERRRRYGATGATQCYQSSTARRRECRHRQRSDALHRY